MNFASNKFRRAVFLFSFIGVILHVWGACTGDEALNSNLDNEDGSQYEDHYVEGVLGNWGRLNPLFVDANPVDGDIARLVFSGLVRIASDGSVVSDMAYMPDVDEAGTSYTFTLKKDLKWHDGTPVTSRDVFFTIKQITEPDFRGSEQANLFWRSLEVEVPDERTIIVKLQAPFSPFLARFATIGILPEHLLRGLSGEDLYNAPFNAFPIGSGPYRINKVTSSSVHFLAWEDYHFGEPAMEKFQMRFYKDLSTALVDIEEKSIQGLYLRDFLSLEDYEKVVRIKDSALYDVQRSGALVLSLNVEKIGYFDDYRVRKAFSLVLDRARIAETVFFGRFNPSSSFVVPDSWAYVPEEDVVISEGGVTSSYQQNLKLANELLSDAGWREHPTTGIRINGENEEFNFIIRTDHDPAHSKLALEIAKHLELLGVRISVATTPFSVLLRDFLVPGNYDAALIVIDPGADPDPYFFLHSSQTLFAGFNVANFTSLSVDKLIERGREYLETDIRFDVYKQLQELWRKEIPAIVLGYPMDTYIYPVGSPALDRKIVFSSADRFFDIHLWP